VHLHGLIAPANALQHVLPCGFVHDSLSKIFTENEPPLVVRLSRTNEEKRHVLQSFKKAKLLMQKEIRQISRWLTLLAQFVHVFSLLDIFDDCNIILNAIFNYAVSFGDKFGNRRLLVNATYLITTRILIK
jgi:hypothetical protein